jgi:hypothetical protein
VTTQPTLEKRVAQLWCRAHMATLTKIKRTIRAAIQAAKQEGVPEVVVTVDDATVRIPLAPDKPLAESRPNSFDQVLGERR